MEASAQTLAGGRVVVNLHDDSGVPFKFISNTINLLGVSEFNEFISIPLTPDKDATPRPRPAMTRGQVIVTAQSAFDGVTFQYVLADVVVVGYVGTTPTVIARAQLGADGDQLRVPFQEDDTFDRIAILARAWIDGRASSSTTNIQALQLSAIANMWS